jgi:hypothetical protein
MMLCASAVTETRAAAFALALVTEGAPKQNAAQAYTWAQAQFSAKTIPRPRDKGELTAYGVVWWDESNGAAIPAAFLDKATVAAFRGYVEAGGALLLSNLAFHYVEEMGFESGKPRYFGANANSPLDWTDIVIAKGAENHPIFNGMKVDKGVIQYDIQGWTDGSDFCVGPTGPKEGKVLAQVADGHPQCNPLVEYSVGSGTAVIIGWVWSSWVVNKKLENTHAALHANIVTYLASKSRFAAVRPGGRSALTWGALKQ